MAAAPHPRTALAGDHETAARAYPDKYRLLGGILLADAK